MGNSPSLRWTVQPEPIRHGWRPAKAQLVHVLLEQLAGSVDAGVGSEEAGGPAAGRLGHAGVDLRQFAIDHGAGTLCGDGDRAGDAIVGVTFETRGLAAAVVDDDFHDTTVQSLGINLSVSPEMSSLT